MRNCFQYRLEGHSETSNDQTLLNPFDHYIKLKAFMRVEGEDTLPRGRLLSPPTTDYVHRNEIGETASSMPLKGIKKLQMTRLFSIHLIIT